MTAQKPRRRWLKRILIGFVLLIALLVLNVLFPNILIAPIAKGQIESGMSGALTLQARIRGLSLDFFGRNEVTGLELRQDEQSLDDAPPISCETLAIGVNALGLTADTVEISTIEVKGLRVESELDSTGLSVTRMFGSRSPEPKEPAAEPQPEPAPAEPPAEETSVEPVVGGVALERVRIEDVAVVINTRTLRAPVDAPDKPVWVPEKLEVRGFYLRIDKVLVSRKGELLASFPWALGASFYYNDRLLGEIALKGKVAALENNTVLASIDAQLSGLDLNPYFDLRGSGTMSAETRVPLNEVLKTTATLALRVPEVVVSGISSSGLEASLDLNEERLVTALEVGDLKGGSFALNGQIAHGEDDLPWSGNFEMRDLPVTKDWFVWLEHLNPVFAFATVPEDVTGKFSLSLNVNSRGDDLDKQLAALDASGSIRSRELGVQSPIFAGLGALLKEDSWNPMTFTDFSESFTIRKGQVTTSDIPLVRGRSRIVLSGTTSLESELDYGLKLEAIDGRDLSALNLGKRLIKVTGSVSDPQLKTPSSLSELLGGTIEDLLRNPQGLGETLQGIFGDDEDDGDGESTDPQEKADEVQEKIDEALRRFGGGLFPRRE